MSKSLFPFHSPSLPIEVCEEIITLVDEDVYAYETPYRSPTTTRVLYSCALVCRSWTTRARIHLFRTVTVNSKSASNIVAVLTTSHSLGSFVQRIDFEATNHDTDPSRLISNTSTTPEHKEWIYNFFNKVIRVSLLPNLAFVQYHGLPALHPSFYICPPRVPSLTSLSLSSVDVASVGDILRLISYYKCLRELYISEGAWGQFSHRYYYFGQRWSCNLRVLSIKQSTLCGVFHLFSWLAHFKPSCSFEHLILRWGFSSEMGSYQPESSGTIPSLPKHIALGWASTLKTLSLNFCANLGVSSMKEPPIVPKLLPFIKTCYNLHTIRLQTINNGYRILQQLPDILRSLESLRRFAIFIGRNFEEHHQQRGGLWGAVDSVFMDPGKLSKVEYVEFMWTLPTPLGVRRTGETSTNADGESRSDRLDVYVDLMKEHFADLHRNKPLASIFPCLSARGILWYSLGEKIKGVDSEYALEISPEISSPDWSPRFCRSLLDFNWRRDY